MYPVMSAISVFAVSLLLVAFVMLTLLVFRAQRSPSWIKNETVGLLASLMLTAVIGGFVAIAWKYLVDSGFGIIGSGAVALGALLTATMLLGIAADFRRRLERLEKGLPSKPETPAKTPGGPEGAAPTSA